MDIFFTIISGLFAKDVKHQPLQYYELVEHSN